MNDEIMDNEQIERIGRGTYLTILNILTESPIFYATDDPVRFSSLRRHKSAFEKFFSKFFGWRLYVDMKMARLIRDKSYNPAVKNSQRRYFNLTSRLECILFMILLEFYEHECEEQNFSYEETENLKFTFGSYFDFARKALSTQLGELVVSEKDLDSESRNLLRKLEQFRLLKVIEQGENKAADGFVELLIEALPGLGCYESKNMSATIIAKAYGSDMAEFEDEPVTEKDPEVSQQSGVMADD